MACTKENLSTLNQDKKISLRTLPTYILTYQNSGIQAEYSSSLSGWGGPASTGTTSLLGTSSTLYCYDSPGNRTNLTVFQGTTGNQLYSIEFEDGVGTWTSPNPINSETSVLLPSVESSNTLAHEVHATNTSNTSMLRGTNKSCPDIKNVWGTTYNETHFESGEIYNIYCNYSPSLEFHPTTGVEFLMAGYDDEGFSTSIGRQYLYWRGSVAAWRKTSDPGIFLNSPTVDGNRSPTLVAAQMNRDNLFVFYTNAGSGTQATDQIRFYIGNVPGIDNGNISVWDGPYVVAGAFTAHKMDGFYDFNLDRLVIVYRNASTANIDIAYSDDYGSNWSFITGIASTSGAPSITFLDSF